MIQEQRHPDPSAQMHFESAFHLVNSFSYFFCQNGKPHLHSELHLPNFGPFSSPICYLPIESFPSYHCMLSHPFVFHTGERPFTCPEWKGFCSLVQTAETPAGSQVTIVFGFSCQSQPGMNHIHWGLFLLM